MKKLLILFSALSVCLGVYAYSIDSYKQSANSSQTAKTEKVQASNSDLGEKREIKNIDEYLRYLSHEVQRNWTPYKSERNYEVSVQFTIHRNGDVSDIRISNTTFRDANVSVLNAVKKGIPYQPLPKSYAKDKVRTQVVLGYKK